MTIEKIDYDLCNGCGICVNTCWIDVIQMDEKFTKPVIKYPDNCVSCNSCATDCPQHAIVVSMKKVGLHLSLWGT